MFLFKDNNKIVDENTLYTKQFKNVVLKFEKYDYALGQKILVGVEKSTDKGKTFKKTFITKILKKCCFSEQNFK